MITLLDAVKMAYRKHHLDDPTVGWDELSDVLMMALCNEMGDKGFQNWLQKTSAQHSGQRTAGKRCAKGDKFDPRDVSILGGDPSL